MGNKYEMYVPQVKGIDLDEIYNSRMKRDMQQVAMEELQDKRATRNQLKATMGGMGEVTPDSLMQAGRSIMGINPDEGIKMINAAANLASHQQQTSSHQSTQAIKIMTALSQMAQSVKSSANPAASWEAVKSMAKSMFGQLPAQFDQPYNPQLVDMAVSFTSNAVEQQQKQLALKATQTSIDNTVADNKRADERFQWDKANKSIDDKSPYANVRYMQDPTDGSVTGAFGVNKKTGELEEIPLPRQQQQQQAAPKAGSTQIQVTPPSAQAAPSVNTGAQGNLPPPMPGGPFDASGGNTSAPGYTPDMSVIGGPGKAKGGHLNTLRTQVKSCGGRAKGGATSALKTTQDGNSAYGSASFDAQQAQSLGGKNALNMTVVGEKGPEVVLTPQGSDGYVLPITDKHADDLLNWGVTGRADGGGMGGNGDDDRDSGGVDNGGDGDGDRGMDAGSLGGEDRGGTGSSMDGSDYGGHGFSGGGDGGGNGRDSSGGTGGLSQGILGGKFRGDFNALQGMMAMSPTTSETMDGMDPSQRAAYASNIQGLDASPFSSFGGDMSQNSPMSKAGSMFSNAQAQQVVDNMQLGQAIDQGLQMAGYPTQQGTPTNALKQAVSPLGGTWSALYAGDVAPTVTSDFGYRTHPVTGQQQSFHNAIDLAGAKGSYLTSSTNGTVVDTGYQKNLGNYANVRDENGYTYSFGHMESPSSLSVGDSVAAGDIVGKQGMTGRATGPHTHYGVTGPDGKSIDPASHHGLR